MQNSHLKIESLTYKKEAMKDKETEDLDIRVEEEDQKGTDSRTKEELNR